MSDRSYALFWRTPLTFVFFSTVEEVDSLEKKLEANEAKIRDLTSQLGKTETEKQSIEDQERGGRERQVEAESEIERLRRELATKDDLVSEIENWIFLLPQT